METKMLVSLLNKGVTVWNTWRAQNENAYIDLTHIDLSNHDLSGFDLQYADFSGSNLRGAILKGANLSYAVFVCTKLDQNCLTATIHQGVNLDAAFVDGTSLHH